MKKTFTINISGSVFHIDEDAYEKLQSYLQMLNRHFNANIEGREILQDIEARIAELFNEKISDGNEVIIEPWVDEVIARMGKPEDFMDEEETTEQAHQEEKPAGEPTQKIKRRLYRDPDSRVLGGVSSGIGAYFNIDPVIIRIIFFALFFVIGPFNILLYLMLWIAVPKARTTAQRLEMRGEDATVSNIQKSIKEEVKEVKDNFQRIRNSDGSVPGQHGFSRLGELVYEIFRVALKVLVILIGCFLVISGIIGLISFFGTMVLGHSLLHNGPFIFNWGHDVHVSGLFNHFVSPGTYAIAIISVVLLVSIPLLLILFAGSKMIFRYKTNNRIIGLASLGTWLVALIVLISISIGQIGNFSKKTTETTNNNLPQQSFKTLTLDMNEDMYDMYDDTEINLNHMKMVSCNGQEIILGEPRLTIEKSHDNDFSVTIKKQARGNGSADAQKNIETIVYNYQLKDSTLNFDPYYTLKDNAQWRDQEVFVTLKMPVGKTIFLSENMKKIIYDIDNVNNTWDGDMVGKYWTMTSDGLKMQEEPVKAKISITIKQ